VRRVTRACNDRGIGIPDPVRLQLGELAPAAEDGVDAQAAVHGALEQEAARLHENRVRLKIIGDMVPFGRAWSSSRTRPGGYRAKRGAYPHDAAITAGADLMQLLLKLARSGPLPADGYTEEQLVRIWRSTTRRNLIFHSHRRRSASVISAVAAAYTECFTPTLWPDSTPSSSMRRSPVSRARARFGRTTSNSKKPNARSGGRRRIA